MADPIRGFPFPFKVDQAGGITFVEGADKLRQNVVQLLLTDIGERVMRRDYGGGVRALVQDPNNDPLRAIVQHQLSKALAAWEPRAKVQQITIDPSANSGTFTASVAFVASASPVPTTARVPIGIGT